MCSDLIARIRSSEDAVSAAAWQSAEVCGSAAVGPLAELLNDPDAEIARRGKRALYRIVRHAGRPGARGEAKAVERELIAALKHGGADRRRELLRMLSGIGGSSAVGPIAALLSDAEVREDARCALTRIPGRKATAALRAALKQAPANFRPALAESLRQRGQNVEGYPSQKLVPVAQTTVRPLPPRQD
jgi:hypothetical protein